MKNKEQTILGNIIKVLLSNFWVTTIGLICSFVFPKIMTIEDYVFYHKFTLYVGYIAILHLGFPSGMVVNYAGKDYQEIDKKQYKSEILLLLIVLFFFTALGAIGSVVTSNRMFLYITCAILPGCLIGSYKALYQAWGMFTKYTRVNITLSTSIPITCLIFYFLYKKIPGDVYIISYLLVYGIVTIIILRREFCTIKHVKSNPLLNRTNWETEKVGILLVLGNYINTLFVSVDKQFVNIFFDKTAFAFYSFAMSMQAIMTVFITSISQPFFPAMAQGKFSEEEYNKLKEILLIFGSYSGCAYFATAIIVRNFIEKYVDSLSITGIYFAVFPAMAVINCLYINLYKIKRMTKTYVITLSGILLTAIVLNLIAVNMEITYAGVAIATTITYYLWLIIGTKQFEFIKITFRDTIFLTVFFILFFTITRTMNDYLGFVCYFVTITLAMFICYGKHIQEYMTLYTRK